LLIEAKLQSRFHACQSGEFGIILTLRRRAGHSRPSRECRLRVWM
jgi:hypothetical protein